MLTLEDYLMGNKLISIFSLFPRNVFKKMQVFFYLCFHSHYPTGLKCPIPFNFFMCKPKPHHPFHNPTIANFPSITSWFPQTEVILWTLDILCVSFSYSIEVPYLHIMSPFLECKVINRKVYLQSILSPQCPTHRGCFIDFVDLMAVFLDLNFCSKDKIFHESQNVKMKLMQGL